MTTHELLTPELELTQLRVRAHELEIVNHIALRLSTAQDLAAFLNELTSAIVAAANCERTILFLVDEPKIDLEFKASNYRISPESAIAKLRFRLFEPEPGSLVDGWTKGESRLIADESSQPNPQQELICKVLGTHSSFSIPLLYQGQLLGVIFVDNPASKNPLTEVQQNLLISVSRHIPPVLENARLHQQTLKQLADNVRELNILQQIDRELSDTINLDHVFAMTLDWALRFSNSQAISLALYDQDNHTLHYLMEYGYDVSSEQLHSLRQTYGDGVTRRVAHSGRAEVIPDVTADPDFVRLLASTRAQMCVPVTREDRVIGVITLESRKINGFTDAHLDFVQKLAARAAVAIDNARLYEESVREREKLSHILNNTADVVILVGTDDRVSLINQSALGALQLYQPQEYAHQIAVDLLKNTPLLAAYQRAKQRGDASTEEIIMPNERVFHAAFRFFEGIGWIIVMHDITPFKEMDRLKSELIGTVSHDLKQPLSVMNGYVELLMMQQSLSPRAMNSVNMIKRSVQNMRQLIDDLLDLTKIESGIKLDLKPLNLNAVVAECIDQIRPNAQAKSINLTNQIPADLPPVMADYGRIKQILNNLISNAVKYTPAEGWAKVTAERRGEMIRIAIQDNGMGMSPEDQIHVFERFYRVRRPETDTIEGTGLGLAIVKSLVEAHHGQIGLESKLGEGSTFSVMLPLATAE